MKNLPQKSREEYWRGIIYRFHQSGMSRRQFCMEENISYWSFRDRLKKTEIAPEEKLVKIPRRTNPGKNTSQSFIDIIVSGQISIRITRGFDGDLLRDVMNELGVSI